MEPREETRGMIKGENVRGLLNRVSVEEKKTETIKGFLSFSFLPLSLSVRPHSASEFLRVTGSSEGHLK